MAEHEFDDKVQDAKTLVAPYCGGCGHRFYRERPVPADEADAQAQHRRCHYCLDDMREEQKRRRP